MKRLFSYDISRITALFMIVMVHVSAYVVIFFPNVDNKEWLVGNIFNGVARAGVPLFIMLSGALLLNESKKLEPKKFYKTHLVPMVFLTVGWLLFYGVFYAFLLPLAKGESGSFDSLLKFMVYFKGSEYPHLWYMYMVLGLYLMIPVLRLFVKRENKKYIEGIIIASLVVQFARTTAIIFPAAVVQDLTAIIDKLCLQPVTGYLGYILLGWYLDNFDLGDTFKKVLYALGGVALVASTVAIHFTIDKIPAGRDYLYSQLSLPPVLYGSALFVLFKTIFKDRETKKGLSSNLSRYSFGIYMIHVLFLEIIVQLVLPYERFALNSPLVYIILVFAVVMSLSYLSVMLFDHAGKAKRIFYLK